MRAARSAIQSHLLGAVPNSDPATNSRLLQLQGVFVSLLDISRGRKLRGCIGVPLQEKPLLSQLTRVAIEATTMDPRFDPVDFDEFRHKIVVEVTILTPAEEIKVKNPLEFRDRVVVGRDGLIVEGLASRGPLLPQVAVEEGFEAEEFLSQCCMKAGLLPDAWLSGRLRVLQFQGQVFSEDEPAVPSPRGTFAQCHRAMRISLGLWCLGLGRIRRGDAKPPGTLCSN